MLSRYGSLSQHGQIQPHSKSKAWKLSTQLRLSPIPHEFFFSHVRDKTKNIFLNSLPSSKLTISIIPIYRQYAIDIPDPSSMHDACHMNFVTDLAHCRVSVAQW